MIRVIDRFPLESEKRKRQRERKRKLERWIFFMLLLLILGLALVWGCQEMELGKLKEALIQLE